MPNEFPYEKHALQNYAKRLVSIRSQMLYPVELRAQNPAFTYKNTLQLQQPRVILSREIPLHNFGRLHTDRDLKDRRPTFHVHRRKISLVPPRGGKEGLTIFVSNRRQLPERGPRGAMLPADMRYGEENRRRFKTHLPPVELGIRECS